MTKITTATPEQWQQIEAVKERWIVRQSEKIPFQDCLSAVHEMWMAMKQEKPIVLQVDGPIALVTAYVMLRDQLDDQLDDQLHDQLRGQLRGQLPGQLHNQLDGQLDDQLRGQLHGQLHGQLYGQLHGQLDGQIYLSVWWGAYAGWYEGGKVLGVAYTDEKYKLFLAWCKSCPIVLPGKSLVLVCQNPEAIHWQNGLLHNDAGPSVRYRDGFSLYTIDGIAVDEQIVMRPETQTVEQILKEGNADKKSIRANRFGWPKLLRAMKAIELDTRKNEIEGTIEALYQSILGNRLVVSCPTGRVFALGVPEQVRTCEQAAKWLDPHASNFKSRVIART